MLFGYSYDNKKIPIYLKDGYTMVVQVEFVIIMMAAMLLSQ